MVRLTLLYLLLAVSGVGLTSALRLRSALDNGLMAVTLGAAQLIVSIQLLSLVHGLTPGGLLMANGVMTLAVILLTRRRFGEFFAVSRSDLSERLTEIARSEGRVLYLGVVAIAVFTLIFLTIVAWLIHPAADAYHYTMLCFWKQNGTILPFEAYDPRIIGVTFLGEALCLPGVLYAQTAGMFPLIAGIAVALAMLLVFAIARQIGATIGAALCAGALLMGYGTVATSLVGGRADMLWSAMWFTASIHFALRTRSPLYAGLNHRLLECSMFCFLIACGTKNTVTMLAPMYAASILLLRGRALLSKSVALRIFVSGALGLVTSGVIWVYASNWHWFGDPRGPEYLKGTLSTDFRPQAVWTRLARGTVMLLFDVIWVPESRRSAYAGFCQQAVRMLGGSEVISEDKGFYTFHAEEIRPRTSLGWLGSMVLVPSLAFASWMCLRSRCGTQGGGRRLELGVLILLAAGSFVTLHVLLRWQSIGIDRFTLPGVIAGAPLVALLVEKRSLRVWALLVGFAAMLAYAVFGFGTAARRLAGSADGRPIGGILKLQRSHLMTVEWQWHGKPTEVQEIKESFTLREIVHRLLRDLPKPTTIGLIGINAEGYYLFGSGLSNKVVSLSDARDTHRFLAPPADVKFLVLERTEPSVVPSEILQGFVLLVEVKHEGEPILVVFERSK